ncbi:DUF4193 domain-containing protein [Kitasatospora sp. DSM 101779]|uniref:DUF4193 domain-containing protein n=1 Tax=Kitasatospora sp. DSM 101779 TaxID=2853165 RepID=UPI0021DA39B6|nr:DUF4193 domain-containing protein [Kitasatospora sp. DSM 101779]MCU7827240.1 DUF4193 domain-containing protein [Kitasatospora sp. DSM 101779]
MATDYDAPRDTGDGVADESIEALKGRRDDEQSAVVDVDAEAVEGLELPGADLSGEELTVQVVPLQEDEFTCMTCFLVHHRTQLAGQDRHGQPVCRDCAS